MARSLAGSARPSTDRLFFDTLADLFDPPKVDVFGLLGYEPTPRQAEFHQATEFDLLYGGAAGGGKTRALLMEGLKACITYPGIAVLAIRESYPQLAESFIAELARVTYAQALGATYNKTEHNLNFSNGSQIRFRYCDGLEDAKLRLGSEIQLLLVDEATMQAPEAIDFLGMRLRSSNPAIPVLGIRHGSNPGGIGHAWAKQRYVDGTDHGLRVYEDVVDDKPTGHMVRFIPARYTDNPHVPDYESVLDAIKDPALRVAYRDGSWDTFAGQFFTEWNRDRHVVPAFAIPEDWTRITGMDWGYAAPHAVLWGAVNDRRVWIYRELYGTQVGERELAKRVLRAEGALTDGGALARERAEHVRVRVGDPSMWNKVAEATPIAGTFAAEGVPMVKAANDRIAGWQRVHTYLAEGPACDIHREMGWDTCPLLHVLEGAAPNLVRTLPALPHDPKKAEDVDTDAEDHAPDALRYLLMHLTAPVTRLERIPEPATPQERIRHQLDRNRRRDLEHPVLGSL